MTLWGLCDSGMGPMPERQKAGAWKAMKTLRVPAALASSNHVFNSFICASYWGRSASHDDGERAVEIELIDEPLVGNPELLQVWKSLQQALDVGVVPHFVIAHSGENATTQAGGAHLIVRGRQPLQYIFIHQLPVGVLRRRGSLLAPPNHVPGIKNELGPSALDVLHDFAGNPLAALQPEHRAPHAGEQLYILDGCLGDPALVDRQGSHFAFGLERHDDLNQLIVGRVIGELDILPNDLFRDLLGKDKRKYVDHQLDRFLPLIR